MDKQPVYPTVYVQETNSLYIYKAQLSHPVRFTALYSDKTHFPDYSIYTRLIPIPLSDTPIVQKLINLFNLYKEGRLQKTKKTQQCLHSVKFVYMVYPSLTKTKAKHYASSYF